MTSEEAELYKKSAEIFNSRAVGLDINLFTDILMKAPSTLVINRNTKEILVINVDAKDKVINMELKEIESK